MASAGADRAQSRMSLRISAPPQLYTSAGLKEPRSADDVVLIYEVAHARLAEVAAVFPAQGEVERFVGHLSMFAIISNRLHVRAMAWLGNVRNDGIDRESGAAGEQCQEQNEENSKQECEERSHDLRPAGFMAGNILPMTQQNASKTLPDKETALSSFDYDQGLLCIAA